MDKVQQELIAGYMAKAGDKLRVAGDLVLHHEWDDAVSRAYYAAFHATHAVLLTEGKKADTHRGLVTLFGLLLVKTGKFDKKWGKFLANGSVESLWSSIAIWPTEILNVRCLGAVQKVRPARPHPFLRAERTRST